MEKKFTLVEKRLKIKQLKRKIEELNDNIYYTAKLFAYDKELDTHFIKRVQLKNFEEKAKLLKELEETRRK